MKLKKSKATNQLHSQSHNPCQYLALTVTCSSGKICFMTIFYKNNSIPYY